MKIKRYFIETTSENPNEQWEPFTFERRHLMEYRVKSGSQYKPMFDEDEGLTDKVALWLVNEWNKNSHMKYMVEV